METGRKVRRRKTRRLRGEAVEWAHTNLRLEGLDFPADDSTTFLLECYVDGRVTEADLERVCEGKVTPSELCAGLGRKTKPKKAKLKKKLFRECGDCDGCGWVEGGRGVIQTTCVSCKGKGRIRIEKR